MENNHGPNKAKRAVLLFIILLILSGLIFSCSKNEPVSETPPLPEYSVPEITPENNAAPLLMKAAELYIRPDENEKRLLDSLLLSGEWKEEHDGLLPWMKKNDPALSILRQAAEKPGCLFPWEINTKIKMKYSLVSGAAGLASLEMATAAKYLDTGAYDPAGDCYAGAFAIGRMLWEGEDSYVTHTRGLLISGHLFNNIYHAMVEGRIPEAAVLKSTAGVENTFPGPKELALKFFHYIPGGVQYTDIGNEIRKMKNADYQKINGFIDEKNWPALMEFCNIKTGNITVNMNFLKNPSNAVAKQLWEKIKPVLWRQIMINEFHRANFFGLRAAAAARLYREKYGKLPGAMEDLTPEFIKSVPADPFSGKPFNIGMTASGPAVYSIGPDMKDDRGMTALKGIYDIQNCAGGDLVYPLDSVTVFSR